MAQIIQFKSRAQIEKETREEIERDWLEFLEWERQMIAKNEGKTEQEIFGLPDEIKDMKF